MSCVIFGAGDYFGLEYTPTPEDYVIAADGGWKICEKEEIIPTLLLGDFDSLGEVPAFDRVERVPVEKDDTDMMLAIKRGLEKGEKVFHIYGGLGGSRTDHTMANMQALLYLCHHGAHGWLYGNEEKYTAICEEVLALPAQKDGIFSVFCLGADAEGVSIHGGHYEVENVVLGADFPLGVSNHFEGKDVTIGVNKGSLLIGFHAE